MRCVIPKYSGFCFDVGATVKAAYSYTDGSTYMYGEIVNNPAIINDLQSKGLKLIHNLDDMPKKDGLKVLIRAHGVPEAVINDIIRRGYKVIDKTCPNVKRVQNIVAKASGRGLDVIIAGTPNHPEVIGILGWSKTKTIIIQDLEQAKAIIPNTIFTPNGVCMVAQTTHNRKEYEEIKEYCATVIPNIEFHDTVCDATEKRQGEVRRLAKSCDGVIVAGGRISSNVTKLYEIASEYCRNVQHVESAKEVDLLKLDGVNSLMVVGGASTPDSSVDEIVAAVKKFCSVRNIPFEAEYLRDKAGSDNNEAPWGSAGADSPFPGLYAEKSTWQLPDLFPYAVTPAGAAAVKVMKDFVISASSAEGRPGEKVTVDISVENNPGIAGFVFNIVYSSGALEFVAAEGSMLTDDVTAGNFEISESLRSLRALWVSSKAIINDGVLYSVTFKIKDDAPEGELPLVLSYNNGNISSLCLDTLYPKLTHGVVTVYNSVLGDINCDGKIDIKDRILLTRYIAGDITLSPSRFRLADLNRDGMIDSIDAAMLDQLILSQA